MFAANLTKTLLFTFLFCPLVCLSQVPCGTVFTGIDACSAEPLSVGTDCASSQEEFRINACGNFVDPGTSCGSDFGTNEVWGRFITTTADTYTITWTPTNNRNLVLHLYTSPNPCDFAPTFTEVACANNNGTGIGAAGEETISVSLAAGTTYYVMGECLNSTGVGAGTSICVYSSTATPPVTASDCSDAVNVCTNLNFQIDPSGSGSIVEFDEFSFPTSNPQTNPNPLPGNLGCLQSGELNSTWLIVNISGGGDLEFSLGQEDLINMYCYDWTMWSYDVAACGDIPADAKVPISCNWNGSCESFTGMANPLPPSGNHDNFEHPLSVNLGDRYLLCFSNFSSALTTVPLSFFGSASVSCTPLPMVLSKFEGEPISMGNRLKWETTTEAHNDFFTLEREENGEWLPVVFVNGAGNSVQVQKYETIDYNPVPGVNLYRLKQTDFDGSYTYSDVIAIDNTGEQPLIYDFYASSSGINFKASDHLFDPIHIRLFSVSGQLVQQLEVQEGGKHQVELSDVQEGIYFVEFHSNGKSETFKVIITEHL